MRDTADNRQIVTKAVYLYKIALDQAAGSCGGQVRYISQHSLLWGALGKPGFNQYCWLGVCAGLAIEWIKAQKQGKDYIEELRESRMKVWSSKDRGFLQEMHQPIQASHYLQNDLETALKGFCKPTNRNIVSSFPFDNLCSSMRKGKYYYMFTGSHVTAAYCAGSRVNFYDPDVGEAQGMTKNALRDFVRTAIESSYIAQDKPKSDAANSKKNITVFEFA